MDTEGSLMKALAPIPRHTTRPSEYTVQVTGTTHTVVDIECDTCGVQRVAYPIAVLALLVGCHLPCGICFEESSTRVVRDLDVSELYDECR